LKENPAGKRAILIGFVMGLISTACLGFPALAE
jgi:hypothetical protein